MKTSDEKLSKSRVMCWSALIYVVTLAINRSSTSRNTATGQIRAGPNQYTDWPLDGDKHKSLYFLYLFLKFQIKTRGANHRL